MAEEKQADVEIKKKGSRENEMYTMEDLVGDKPSMTKYGFQVAFGGLCTYFILMLAAKIWFPDNASDRARNPDQIIKTVNSITAGIFCCNAVMNLQMVCWSKNANQKTNQICTFVINIIAGLSHACMATGFMPVFNTGRDRWLFIAKYIEWLIAGGLIPFLTMHTAHMHEKLTFKVAISSSLMMLMGLIGKVTPPGPDILFYVLGWLFFCPFIYICVFLAFHAKLRSHNRKMRTKIRVLALTQLCLWLVFPIVYMVADFGGVTRMFETIFYNISDVVDKCCFTWVLNGVQFETQETNNEEERANLSTQNQDQKGRFQFVMRAMYN